MLHAGHHSPEDEPLFLGRSLLNLRSILDGFVELQCTRISEINPDNSQTTSRTVAFFFSRSVMRFSAISLAAGRFNRRVDDNDKSRVLLRQKQNLTDGQRLTDLESVFAQILARAKVDRR